jgi:hypothetical protein
MKRLSIFLFCAAILAGCTQAPKNQVFVSGPEVDNIQKSLDAYVAGDWATFRANYADTAISMHNTIKMDMDSLMRFHQNARKAYDKVEMSTIFKEVLQYEDGSKWTHYWGVWKGTIKGTGQTIDMPIHISGKLVQGKVAEEHLFYDPSAIRAALTPAPAPMTK